MLIGYARVSKADGSQSLDLQRDALIAASVGPYGATMADGSEYHGNYGLTDQALREFHKDRLFLLDQTAADILACETIPSQQEAHILHDLLLETETPAWVSLSCKDGGHINDGTAIEEIATLFQNNQNDVKNFIGKNKIKLNFKLSFDYIFKYFNILIIINFTYND